MPDRQPLTPEEYNRVRYNATRARPAGLSDDEFENYIMQAARREEAAKAASDVEHGGTVAAGPEWNLDPMNVVSGFLGGVGRGIAGLAGAVAHPIDTVKNLVTSQFVDQPVKAYQALKEGDYLGALGHAGAAAIPVLGPVAADIGERTGETGDIGNAIGETGALLAMKPEVGGAALRNLGGATEALGESLRRPANYMAGWKLLSSAGGGGVAGMLPAAGVMAAPAAIRLAGKGLRLAGTGYEALPRVAESVQRMLGPMSDTALGSAADDAYGVTAPRSLSGDIQGVLRAPAGEALRSLFSKFGTEPEAPEAPAAPRGPRVSREVPGFTYPGDELQTTPEAGTWSAEGPTGYGPPRPFLEGEIVPEDIDRAGGRTLGPAPIDRPGGRTLGAAPAEPEALPPGPAAPPGLPPPSFTPAGPSSIEALENAADRRIGQLGRAQPDEYLVATDAERAAMNARAGAGASPLPEEPNRLAVDFSRAADFNRDEMAILRELVNQHQVDPADAIAMVRSMRPPGAAPRAGVPGMAPDLRNLMDETAAGGPPPPPPAAAAPPAAVPPPTPRPAPPTVAASMEGEGLSPAAPSLESLLGTLTDPERALAGRLVTQQGMTPAEAVADVIDANAYRGPRPTLSEPTASPFSHMSPEDMLAMERTFGVQVFQDPAIRSVLDALAKERGRPQLPLAPAPPAAAPPPVIQIDARTPPPAAPPAAPAPAAATPPPASIASLGAPGTPAGPRLPPRVTSAGGPAVLVDAARQAVAKIRELGHDAITYDEQTGQWWTERSGTPHSRTRTVRRAGRNLAPLLDVLNSLPVDLVKQVIKE